MRTKLEGAADEETAASMRWVKLDPPRLRRTSRSLTIRSTSSRCTAAGCAWWRRRRPAIVAGSSRAAASMCAISLCASCAPLVG